MTTTELTPNPRLVIVFSGPDCVQCAAEYRHLDQRGIAYESRDAATLSPEVIEHLRQVGKAKLPIVVYPDGEVSGGFRPDIVDMKLTSLPKRQAVAA